MSDIGFENIFDADSFDKGTKKIAEYIERITEEIKDAETAAKGFSKILGEQLKGEIDKLSTSSKTLATDMASITKKMDAFKTTTSNTKKVIADYKKENARLTKELEKVKKAQAGAEKETKKAGTTAKSSAKSLLSMASGVTIMYQSLRFLKVQLIAAVKSTIEFEQAMKEVQAISRASAEQLVLLTENANRLGATTEKTATEIAKLQKELGKLGFNTTEILASTDAIVDLSTATGEDLAQSATVAAATLRAFGLEAVEMNRVVDVMAGSFVRSGLDLNKFQESMKLVAPIARATNISVETTTAALSKLADAGLSGSLAGTALRNLFSEMADPTSKLVNYLGQLDEEFVDGVNSSEEMIRAFKALRDSGVDLAKAVQMVDVRARPAFFTLMNQIDAVEGLTLEYTDLDSEANKIAETMRDTLSNDVKIANSAFDAMRRNLMEEFTPAMRGVVQGSTLMSEAMRFLVDDIASLDEKLDENEKTFLSWAMGATQITAILKGLFGGVIDLTKEYVKESSFEEQKEGFNTRAEAIKGVADQAKIELSVFRALKKAIADDTPYTGLKKALEVLGEEYSSLYRKLTEEGASEEEIQKRLFVRLEGKLKTTKDMLVQQENQLINARRQLRAYTDIEKSGKLLTEDQVKKANLLEAEIEFLETQTKEYSKMETALSDILKVKKAGGLLTVDEEEKLKEINKQLKEQLKLQQQLAEEKVKGDLEVLKIRASKELDPTKKLKLEEEVFKKEAELINLRYKHEIENIEKLHKKDVGYLDMRALAHEKYVNEIEQLYFNFTLTREGQQAKLMESLAKADEKMHEKIKEGIQDSFDAWDENEERKKKKTKKNKEEELEDLKRAAQEVARGLSRITTLAFNNRQIERDNELKAIQEWEEEKLRLAGDNEDAKLRIQEEAARREAVIKKKQAQDNKKEAIFQIIIDTAMGIMKAIGSNPILGIPLGAIIGALGAAQIATVMAQPLPQFAKGTDDSPEGFAEVGERGRELIKDGKTGKWAITPDSSTVTYLTKHSQVITNAETERILSQDHNSKADNYLSNRVKPISAPQIDYGKMGEIMDKAVSKIPSNITNFDENGVTKFVMGRSSKIKRLNKRY